MTIMKRKRPTPGQILKAFTNEVSIVTDPANEDEFLVKNKDGSESGEYMKTLVENLSKMGVNIKSEVDSVADKSPTAEEEALSKDVGDAVQMLKKLDSRIAEIPNEESHKGIIDKVKGVANEIVTKILELMESAGLGQMAADAAPIVASARDLTKETLNANPETPPAGDAQPRPEDTGVGAAAAAAVPAVQAPVAATKETVGNTPDTMAKSITKEDIEKMVGNSIESALTKYLASQSVSESVSKSVSQPESVESKDAGINEQIEALKKSNEELQKAITTEESLLKQQQQIDELMKTQEGLKSKIESLKKIRIGSNGMEPNMEQPEHKEELRKESVAEIFASGPIGAYSRSFSRLHGLNG